MSATRDSHCPTCGSAVTVVMADEGTSHYEPRRETDGVVGQEWSVPFCPECGQAGRHAVTCEFWSSSEIVDAGNFRDVVLAEARDLLLEVIESSGYVETDERIRWLELQVDKELMQRLHDWQRRQVTP